MKKLSRKEQKIIGKIIILVVAILTVVLYNYYKLEYNYIFEGLAVFLTLAEIEKLFFEDYEEDKKDKEK